MSTYDGEWCEADTWAGGARFRGGGPWRDPASQPAERAAVSAALAAALPDPDRWARRVRLRGGQ